MIDFWLLFRMKLGKWMLNTSMDVIPRCDFRDDMRLAVVSVYSIHPEFRDDD